MSSLLETAIRNHRAAMLAEDARALATVLDAYAPARARLIKRIDGLVTTMQERPLTVTELFQWERAKELFAQVDVEVARLSTLTNTQIIDSQGKLVAMAGDHAKALALVSANDPGMAAQISGNWNRINPGATEALIGRMSDGSPLEKTLGRYGPEARSSITEALKRSIVLGTNPRATAAELAKTLDVSAAKLLRITRTEQLQSYRAATLANYRANDDIISGWRWISAHQTRTCMACLSLDGEVFPLTVEFQPSHVQCRCSSIPEINGEPTPDRQTGQEYFDSLSDEDKRKIVPASALNDIQSGKLQLRDFRELKHDKGWGYQYNQASVGQARANAIARTSMVPAKTKPTKVPTIDSVDDVIALSKEMPLYARWQTQDKTMPKFSRNHASGITEPGLSVNGLSGKREEVFVNNITEYMHISGDHLLFVTGDEIAVGSDNEPIITNARIVAKGSKKLIEEAKNYTEIKRCRDLIARGDISMAKFFGCPGV